MSKVVNLRSVRKSRDRDEKRAQGDANAAKFGLTRAERTKQRTEADKARRDLDGHERE